MTCQKVAEKVRRTELVRSEVRTPTRAVLRSQREIIHGGAATIVMQVEREHRDITHQRGIVAPLPAQLVAALRRVQSHLFPVVTHKAPEMKTMADILKT